LTKRIRKFENSCGFSGLTLQYNEKHGTHFLLSGIEPLTS